MNVDHKARLAVQVRSLRLVYGLLRRTIPPAERDVTVANLLHEVIGELAALAAEAWPAPTTSAPDLPLLVQWLWEEESCEATDGCWVKADGCCPHGHPSWLLRLGLL